MQEEDVLCSILVTQWINDGADEERKKKYIETILKNFGANVAVPSLFQISYHAIKNSPKLAHHLVELEDILWESENVLKEKWNFSGYGELYRACILWEYCRNLCLSINKGGPVRPSGNKIPWISGRNKMACVSLNTGEFFYGVQCEL